MLVFWVGRFCWCIFVELETSEKRMLCCDTCSCGVEGKILHNAACCGCLLSAKSWWTLVKKFRLQVVCYHSSDLNTANHLHGRGPFTRIKANFCLDPGTHTCWQIVCINNKLASILLLLCEKSIVCSVPSPVPFVTNQWTLINNLGNTTVHTRRVTPWTVTKVFFIVE